MQVVYARCAGLDVHQKTVSACVQVCEPDGKKRKQVRAFGSFTGDRLGLADWLREQGVTGRAIDFGLFPAFRCAPCWAIFTASLREV